MGINSEYSHLKTVMLHIPRQIVGSIESPESVLHRDKISYDDIVEEFRCLIEFFRQNKVNILIIDPDKYGNQDPNSLYNLFYVRDNMFMTPSGAVISNMSHNIRKHEIDSVKNTLHENGIRIFYEITDPGTLEGADVLWINRSTVLVAVGRRTNKEGYIQLKEFLANNGIECIEVDAPNYSVHLLGSLQFIDKELAVIRSESIDSDLKEILKKNRIKIIEIHETEEVNERFSMNIVVISNRNIIMSSGCQRTKEIFQDEGIMVMAELKTTELANGGGGLACAVSVIDRECIR